MMNDDMNYKIDKMVFIYKLQKSILFKKLFIDKMEENIKLYLNDYEDYVNSNDESLQNIQDILEDFLKYIKNI